VTPAVIATEKHYTVKEVAELWSIGENTVRRLFEDTPGVLRISMPTLTKRRHKPKVTLRIPLSLLERAHEQWSRNSGSSR